MNLAFDLLHESANARGVGEVAVHGYPVRTFDVYTLGQQLSRPPRWGAMQHGKTAIAEPPTAASS
jgi:hypothetical protein